MSPASLMYSGALFQCDAALCVNLLSPYVFLLLKGTFKVLPFAIDLLVVLWYVLVLSFVCR